MTGRYWTAAPAPFGSRSDWYRVRRAVDLMPTGVAVATVVAYPGDGMVALHMPTGSIARLSAGDALGIAACLSAAVEGSIPAANGDGLVLEADLGDGWHRI
ncbi:hypothetical protein [Actinocatenispora sera]|uniref:Uncharacterized protein n=1 Tax=Actinocatenispora sera TaxID=390989 RepID=A0A810KV22_9ACTN|nr:hypothetical protein [Actinocatenispora sera]BCJ26884.1 hypothetical protein Asera_09920 [Actinocatenispora sera]